VRAHRSSAASVCFRLAPQEGTDVVRTQGKPLNALAIRVLEADFLGKESVLGKETISFAELSKCADSAHPAGVEFKLYPRDNGQVRPVQEEARWCLLDVVASADPTCGLRGNTAVAAHALYHPRHAHVQPSQSRQQTGARPPQPPPGLGELNRML
jgi:hypothetical protein